MILDNRNKDRTELREISVDEVEEAGMKLTAEKAIKMENFVSTNPYQNKKNFKMHNLGNYVYIFKLAFSGIEWRLVVCIIFEII